METIGKLFNYNLLFSRCCLVTIVMSLATFVLSEPAAASGVAVDSVECFSARVHFPKSSSRLDTGFGDNAAALGLIRRFVDSCDTLRGLHMEIQGSTSPEGTPGFNHILALHRAEALASWLALPAGVAAPRLGIHPVADTAEVAWPALRYAEITASWVPLYLSDTQAKRGGNLAPGTASEPSAGLPDTLRTDSAAVLAPDTVCAPVVADGGRHTTRRGPLFFVTTNLLYDAALTPNIGVGLCFADRVTVFADWMHAWWSNRAERRYWRVYGGDVEVRLQLGHGRSLNPLSGHRVGVYASLVTYDFQFGRDRTGVMGDKYNYAVGASYGYSLPIARRLSLDFSLGIGYMWGRYKKQHLEDTHDVWQSTHRRRWFGPTRAEIGLTWLIGSGNVNTPRARKGGKR